MSFVRMGCDGSDVYVYQDPVGRYVCHWCSMRKDEGHFTCQSPSTMIKHLYVHRLRDETVPEHAIDCLKESKTFYSDMITEDALKDCDKLFNKPKVENIDPRVKVKMEANINGETFSKGFLLAEKEDLEKLPLMLERLSRSIQLIIQKELDPGDDGPGR